MRLLRGVGLLLGLLALMPLTGWAQPAQTGTISGTVMDSSNAVLPGVTVTVTSQDRGFMRTTVTDGNGRYLFPAVPIGQYRVIATLQGFNTAEASNNVVETSKNTDLPLTLTVGALTDTVVVTGSTPIVDTTTATATTTVRREEFDKLPVGRNYQSLIGAAPGVVGTGNVNALGALTSNNLFIIDAVDTTDPTTGTFGTNLNFEAIQEVSVYTSAAGVEYSRAQGAIVNVVTKSGTNRFEGSAKYIFLNDEWDEQNTTKSEVTGASLARVKFDQVNPVYSFTGGGPIWRDRAWFFGTYELAQSTSPQRQTVGQIPEDFQQVREDKFSNIRGTVQLAEGHTAWVKYYRSPSDGFVIDYWGAAAERESLTGQSQSASNWAAQWSGVVRNNWSMEAAFANYASLITVDTFEASGRLANAPIFNVAESKYYNGATFSGFVERPRQQFNVASNWFLSPGGRSHNIKVGYDFQNLESSSQFDYPNRQLYFAESYVQATGAMVPQSRRDFDAGPSTSTGKIHAVFARDKFELSDRISLEAGVRYELQTGTSDVGSDTVDTAVFTPRVSGTYDITGDGKTLVTGSYGRYYASIIQGFSDAFASVPQQTNYDNFVWNGSAYVFSNRVQLSGSTFRPNTDLEPYHMDEGTIGFQRQFGQSLGAGVRFITRKWDNLIDDVRTFNPDNTILRQVVNYEPAERKYRGVQLTFEKRFANNWNAQGSYTYSQTRGNHFANNFTTLGDYLDAQCRTTADLTVGNGGIIPCAEVNNGANKYGSPIYDRPHNFKLNAAYVRGFGPVNVTVGMLTDFISKRRYQKERTVNVLTPGTQNNAGPTATYYYNELGSDVLDGMENVTDFSTELTWKVAGSHQAGFRAEAFNLFNNEEKIISNNVTWCGNTATAACTTAVNNFGKASARGSFLQPRRYRFSLIYRF
ncbi:MAG: TonB-dependent receptor [Acidobacteriota bacterium]|nr:TonB-dependent receptor [Acidobacteriota bacterium]